MATSITIANTVDTTDAAAFIPEVWSLETLASYKENLVMAALVTLLNHVGKKGDTIHIPVPSRGAAVAKTQNEYVDLIAFSASDTTVLLDQHFHYARLIEDFANMQSIASMRAFFTDDAGHALAKQTDTNLVNLAATWGGATAYNGVSGSEGAVAGGDGTTGWDPGANTNTGNGSAISDAGIRRAIQYFDDKDVPGRNRSLVIPPVEKRRLLGETRFTQEAFVGERGQGNSIRNGLVGDLYGVEIYVSSNLATVAATDTTTNYRPCLLFQKEALVLAEQMRPRVQQQYKLELLGNMVVADTVYGVKTVRGLTAADDGEGCKALMVPAI